MDPGGYGGAFGGGKAGGAQDPLEFLKKPTVVLRLCCLLFAIIVFGCISSQGWSYNNKLGRDVCVMNEQSSACHFPTFVGVMAFIVSLGLIVGEWFFEQFSSIKTRKHYVLADLGFSGLWAFFYFVAFLLMCVAWSKTEPEYKSYASSTIYGAIFFSLCSIVTWGGGAYFAYQRYKAGADTAFTSGIGDDELGNDYAGGSGGYVGDGDDMQYSEPPFSGGSNNGMNYQQPQY